VVTLQGEGKIFSAGHDLKEVASRFANDGHPAGADPGPASSTASCAHGPRRSRSCRRSRPRRPRRESTGSTS
jgi:enoyl-CoA hydratase/carnithine racemase